MSESNKRKTKAAHAAEGDAERTGGGEGESIKDEAVNVLSRAATATKDAGRRAAGAVGDAYRATVATGAAWEGSCEKFVRRNPMTSILVTAGVSLLIGFTLGRETARPPARPWWRP